MNSKLQDLTEKIYQEGIEKAKEESERLIEKARSDADRIRKEAETEKKQLLDQAHKEAESLQKKVNSELQLAGRKLIGQIKSDLSNLVQEKMLDTPIRQNLNDPAEMARLMEMAVSSVTLNGNEVSLRISEDLKKEIENHLEQSKSSLLQNGLTLHGEHMPGGGFKLEPGDGNYLISFTEADFRSFFAQFINPETLQFLAPESA
ncbi:hypothetical protein KFE98_12005 [bacterium SCSIO 12741]|nr:hypothetical protein KFE98_12005 [bacterium SCSIO 12741]